jgi:hypothetical protein
MLSDQEILRRLRTIRFSSDTERNARRSPSLNAVITASGLGRTFVYRIIREGKGLGPRSRARLSEALEPVHMSSVPQRGVFAPCGRTEARKSRHLERF